MTSGYLIVRGRMRRIGAEECAGQTKTGAGANAPTPISESMSGGVLLSHPVSRAVPSALRGLASGFGM
jgi:hypothetical protein